MRDSKITRRGLTLSTILGISTLNVSDWLNIAETRKLHIRRRVRPEGKFKMAIVNARNLRNGWGVNDGSYNSNTAAALYYLGCRWIRNDFGAGVSAANFSALVKAMANYPDPNVKIQGILNDYYQSANSYTWSQQQNDILSVVAVKNPNGTSVLGAIEGPNEMGSGDGNGSVYPNGTSLVANNSFANDTNLQACYVAWAEALSTFRNSNSSALSGVEILAPTILDFTGGNGNYSGLNVSSYVDYGCFHYYSNTTGGAGGTTSGSGCSDDLSDMYNGMCAGQSGSNKLSMVQSECGPQATNQGGGYALDLVSQAWSILMQAFDHFALGGHRFMVYCLFNDSNANFGLFNGSDPNNPTAKAIVLKNFANLMSLGNNYTNSANFTDTASFTPAYTGNGFSINGLQNAGKAGTSLIMPKSDGSTMIAVWAEPIIDNGSNSAKSQVPAANPITVNLGGSYKWNVYDPSGGGGGSTPIVSVTTTPITSGNGSTVNLTLYGTPLLIELTSSTPTAPIKKLPASKNGASINSPSGSPLVDNSSNQWSLVAGSNGNQVAVNGVADTTTGAVIELMFINNQIWQQNSGKTWWYKTSPTSAWLPTAGTTTAPTIAAPSKNGTTITTAAGPSIIDSSGNAWTLASSASSGNQIVINGVLDATTAQVITLGYFNGVIWQENSGKTWWSITSPTGTWSPAAGTATAPTVTATPTPTPTPTPAPTATAPSTSALQTLIGTTVTALTKYGTATAKTAVTALNTALTDLKAVK